LAGFGDAPFGTSPFGVSSTADQSVSPAGIGTAESFGVPVLTSGSTQTVVATAIASSETFGLPTLAVDAVPAPDTGVTLFLPGREGFLDGTVSWLTPTVKASLVRGYTFAASHKFVSDVTTAGGSLVATATLIDKSVNGGIADAGDVLFPTVAAGAALSAVLLYQASAVGGGADVAPSAQRLIGCDVVSVTPLGVDIAVVWANDGTRIFML